MHNTLRNACSVDIQGLTAENNEVFLGDTNRSLGDFINRSQAHAADKEFGIELLDGMSPADIVSVLATSSPAPGTFWADTENAISDVTTGRNAIDAESIVCTGASTLLPHSGDWELGCRHRKQVVINRPALISSIEEMMVSTPRWNLAETRIGLGMNRSHSSVPQDLSEHEKSHALAGGLVVFKRPAHWPSTWPSMWCLVFPTTFGEGLLQSCIIDEDGSQAIETELRRRAMAVVIDAAGPGVETSEPAASALRRSGIGV